jgi:hypothetical protein
MYNHILLFLAEAIYLVVVESRLTFRILWLASHLIHPPVSDIESFRSERCSSRPWGLGDVFEQPYSAAGQSHSAPCSQLEENQRDFSIS